MGNGTGGGMGQEIAFIKQKFSGREADGAQMGREFFLLNALLEECSSETDIIKSWIFLFRTVKECPYF